MRIVIAALLFMASACALAQYPDRPVKIIIPYPPAGGTDILSRYIFNEVGKNKQWRIIIDNRGGATGVIGAREAAQAKPDGYVLLMGHIAPNAINPGEFTMPRFDMDWKMAAVAMGAESPMLLVAHPSIQVKSVAELSAWASRQTNLVYGSDGLGSLSHLKMFDFISGKKAVHVPYKGGGPALVGLMSGEIPMLFSPAPVAMPHIKSNKMRVLAQTASQKLAALPSVPLIPGYPAPLWWGLFAPKGTPQDIVVAWNAAINAAAKAPHTMRWMEEQGYSPKPMSPSEFGKYVDDEIVRWDRVTQKIIAQ